MSGFERDFSLDDQAGGGRVRKSRSKGDKHDRSKGDKPDRSKDSLERKINFLQHRLDEERQASRREKLSLVRLQREMARQQSYPPFREGSGSDLQRAEMLRVESEQRLREMVVENDTCKGRLRGLQEEFRKMEEVVQNMTQYKTKLDQLKHEKSSLAVTYECNLQKYRTQMNTLERENIMLLNEVKKKEQQSSCLNDNRDKSKLLMERLKLLEAENSSLVLENEQQRQQYEKCLDEIANQVVHALLGQKSLREECLKLQDRVQDLELQNHQLSLMFQHKLQFSSEPMLQSYPSPRSQQTVGGFLANQTTASSSVTSLPTQTSSWNKSFPVRQKGFLQVPNLLKRPQSSSPRSSIAFLRDSIDSLQNMNNEHIYEEILNNSIPQIGSPPMWSKGQLGFSRSSLGSGSQKQNPFSNGQNGHPEFLSSYHSLESPYDSSNVSTPVSSEHRFRMKIETEFPATSNASPKMKHVGIVSCGPVEKNGIFSSANQSRASSLSALSMTSSTNQNLSNPHLNSDRLCIKLPYNREEGVKSPGWEWVSPTGGHHDNPAFLSPIDDFSDDESVRMSHGFSSASTVSLNEILDDSLGVEVEESEMEGSSSMENISIPAPNSSIFFSTKPGVTSLAGLASLVQTSSPDSDSGVHTPCITSPVRCDEKTTPGPITRTTAKTTSASVVSSVYIPMQIKMTSPGPERPQSLELRKNGSTSSNSKSRTQSRSIIPKRVDPVSSSLPLAKSKLESRSIKSSKLKGGSSNGLSSNSSSKSVIQTGNSLVSSTKSATKSSTSKSGKASALPRKISNFSSKRPPPDVLPLTATSTPTESSKKKYKFPERNRTIIIASAMDDPPNISKAIDYLTDTSTYVPGIDTPILSQHPDSFDAMCGGSYPHKYPSISSDSSSEHIRVERSGSKDDGYSTMSSDVHPDISDRSSDGTVKRNTILKQDSIDQPSLSPTFSSELKSPSPVCVKTPIKSTPKVSQMPILVKSKTKVKAIPPHPPPKPNKPTTPTRRISKLPVPKSLSTPPETQTQPTKSQKASSLISPTRHRVREMAKMFEDNAVVDKQFLSQKKNRYSFHGDFSNFAQLQNSQEQRKNFRHSFDGSTSVCVIPLEKCIVSSEQSVVSSEKSIVSSEKGVVESVFTSNIGAIPSKSTNISSSAKIETQQLQQQQHEVCLSQSQKTCLTRVDPLVNSQHEKSIVEPKHILNSSVENATSRVESSDSFGCVKAGNKEENCNNVADAVVTDISSKNLLCAALADEFSSPDSISPVSSDSSQDSLTQVKNYESDSVEQYLLYAAQTSELSAHYGAQHRDLRILHDITEESDASQTSTGNHFMRRKLPIRKSAIKTESKEVPNIPKPRRKLYKSKSDSELYVQCKITDSWLGPNSQPKGVTVSVCAIERSSSLGLVVMETAPLSSMPQSLRRSPCQLLVDEDTMSQKATKLLHREHFAGDVYNYSSDSESDFEEAVNFVSLWQQRPMATRALPDWNPKETLASASKGSSNFSMNLHDLRSSSDIEEWLLQFSDKDIEEHLYAHGDSNFILQKNGSRSSDFGCESQEESAAEYEDVTIVTDEESGVVNDTQTRFRREFYSLCRVESNKSLCSGNSSNMGSDLDLSNLTSANENVGTPLENCVQDLCSNPSLATGHSNEKMAEFDKISRQIAALYQTVDDLNRSLSSIDSVDGSSEDIRLDDFKDFKPSNTEESSDGFHWVEDDEFYLAPSGGELMVLDSSLAAENGCYTSDWMNEYVQSTYHQQDEDFHHHLQNFQEDSFLTSSPRISDNHGNSVASCEDRIAQDAETRAALLDRMMDFQESENSDSNSDDENLFFEKSQKNGARYLRKRIVPKFRKGKMEVVKPAVMKQRPVVDFTTFFNRYEEPEQTAVSAFNFLDNFSTSSSEEDQYDNSFDQSDVFQTDQVLPSSGILSCTAGDPRGATGPAVSTRKSMIPKSCEHCKVSHGKSHSRTAKVLKQAANLAKRFSSGSLESQENLSTESLTFSNSCCEGFESSLNGDDLTVL